MNTKKIFQFSLTALAFATVVSSCKKEYEAPPESTDPPGIAATTSIKALKARHTVSGAFDVINDDVIIAGVVIANDKSGNFYKEMYIRDASTNSKDSGCIAVELASTGLYANYPVGRKVFIRCKGLCLSDYKNMIQLGMKSTSNGLVTLEGIPVPLISNYVIGGSLGNDASPRVVTAADISVPSSNTMQFSLLGDLLKLNDYEFMSGDTKRSYADTSYWHSTLKSMVNIKNCNGDGPFIVLTSGYADFATKAPQAGNGSFTGIFTVYSTTPQFVIRDTTDVKFTNPRCFLFEEDFQAYTTTTNCWSQLGWQNIKESGDVCYTLASFSGNIFPKVSAFTSTAMPTTAIKSWLISPAITIPTGITPKFSYTCAHRYFAGTLTALVSTDYDGVSQTPSTATWTQLNQIQANSASFTPFIPYGPFDLSAYLGKKIYIAFRYDAAAGTNKNSVATFEPDDMKISSK